MAAPFLLVFSGLKHSGKSSLARLVASRHDLACHDLDQLIAKLATADDPSLGEAGDPAACVRALYRAQGKERFQAYELAASRHALELGTRGKAVLSLGGGTMENAPAMQAIRPCSRILFLDAPFEAIFERIMRGGIPAFLDPADPEGSFRALYQSRRSLAQAQADHTVDLTGLSIEAAYETIHPLVKEFLHGR